MKQSSVEVGVGIFVLIGIICVGYLTLRLGELELLKGDYYHEAQITFADSEVATVLRGKMTVEPGLV